MKLYSTKDKTTFFSLETAVLKGLPDDNGLFMPSDIPALPQAFWDNIEQYSFQDIAFEVCKNLLGEVIPTEDLKRIVENSVTFPAPLVDLDEDTKVLELWHGPSLAFKDFGARFMAQLMSYFNQKKEEELVILVATSGDTGGAVAAGFYKTPGIKVVILYPSGKVSFLQEKQLTTLGHNIAALEVDGTFDDCQAMVKQAFLDKELTNKIRLSSANSINIARLIPQSFYYIEAYKQLKQKNKSFVFVVPSGNFGNLTAGLLAQKMGMPADKFIAATNANDVVPEYLETAEYRPRPSVRTLSNAMDVGAPSNFARMLDLYGSEWEAMTENIVGYAFNDAQTRIGIKRVEERGYLIDPHGAVGYLAWLAYQTHHPDTTGIILETAHPAKFKPDMEETLGHPIDVPKRLAVLANKPKEAVQMPNDYEEFKAWLSRHY